MSGIVRVEWIGVKSPLQDDRINYRRIAGLYSDREEVLLEAISELLSPLIRQRGSTARAKGKRDGYSKEYMWGPWKFVSAMTELDAQRLFRDDPDRDEFRNLDDPAHDERQPIVPWPYVNKMMWRIMQEAENGPGVVMKGQKTARNSKDAEKLLAEWTTNRIDEAHDRGVTLDPKTLRIVR